MLFFATLECGVAGCTAYEILEADDLEQANLLAMEYALENAHSFFDVVSEEDEEYMDESDSSWGSDYVFYSDVSASVEEFVPELHDGYIT